MAGYWRIDVEGYIGSLGPLDEVGAQWVELMRNTADRLDRLSPIQQSWRLTPGMPFRDVLRRMVNELDAEVASRYRAMGREAYDAYLIAKRRTEAELKVAMDEADAVGHVTADVSDEMQRFATGMDASTEMIDALGDPTWIDRLRDGDAD